MSAPRPRIDGLPPTGYVRQSQLVGDAGVTLEQATANRARGKGPVRPRPAVSAVVPISSATLWRKVKAGQFPAPVKLYERVTAWRVEDVRAWLESQGKGGAR